MHIYLLKEQYQSQHKQEIIQIKKVVFKNCAPLAHCISELNNTQIDNAKDINVVIPRHNLVEYSNSYSKTSGNLWKYCRNEPVLSDTGPITNFSAADNTASFNFKQKITDKATTDKETAGGIKNVEIIVPLKY